MIEKTLKVGKRICWNTGRTYAPEGQRIGAQSIGDCVLMVDFDRGVEYLLENCPLDQQIILNRYDAHQGCGFIPAAYRQIEKALSKWIEKKCVKLG